MKYGCYMSAAVADGVGEGVSSYACAEAAVAAVAVAAAGHGGGVCTVAGRLLRIVEHHHNQGDLRTTVVVCHLYHPVTDNTRTSVI